MSNYKVNCISKSRTPQCDIDKAIQNNGGLSNVLSQGNRTSTTNFLSTGGIIVSTGDTLSGETNLNLLSGSGNASKVIITSAGTSSDSIDINSSGGVDVDASGPLSITSTTTTGSSNLTHTGSSGNDLTVETTAGSLILRGGEAASDAVQITSSNAAGGIEVTAGNGGLSLSSGEDITVNHGATNNTVFSSGNATVLTLGTQTIPDVIFGANAVFDSGSGGGLFFNNAVNVTQTTNNTTAVTANSTVCQITMFEAVPTSSTQAFTLNNNTITANSYIFLTCSALSTTDGIPPTLSFDNLAAGSLTLIIRNIDDTNAVPAPIINVLVVNPV